MHRPLVLKPYDKQCFNVKTCSYITSHLVLKLHYRTAIFLKLAFFILHLNTFLLKCSQSLSTYEESDANTVIIINPK